MQLKRNAWMVLALPLGLVALDACSGRSTYQGGGRREYASARPDENTPPDEDSGNNDPPDTGNDLPDAGSVRDAGADG